MGESRRIEIYNESDVINARLQTREMAKDTGMSIMDQARISLAVSSLAHFLKLGGRYHGQIILNRISDLRRKGVKVVWLIGPEFDAHGIDQGFDNNQLNHMVHELNVQISETSGVCITAVMWTPPPTRILLEEASW